MSQSRVGQVTTLDDARVSAAAALRVGAAAWTLAAKLKTRAAAITKRLIGTLQ